MSKPFDYSKWDNIELSDDEEDCHPNIDKESWFRMKHRSRVEREENEAKDRARIEQKMLENMQRVQILKHDLQKIAKLQANDSDSDDDGDDLDDTEGIKAELAELESENISFQARLDEYEKNKKWNVDNMFEVKEERTVINPKAAQPTYSEAGYAEPKEDLKKVSETMRQTQIGATDGEKKPAAVKSTADSDAEATTATKPTPANTDSAPNNTSNDTSPSLATKSSPAGPARDLGAMDTYHEFTEKYADLVEQFMALPDLAGSEEFLLRHGDVLLQENASNYLLLASLEDEMNGYHDKMKRTARQSQIITSIAELAKTVKTHPGNVIRPFFQRLKERLHLEEFLAQTKAFQEKIVSRAVVKRQEIDRERAQEARNEKGTSLEDIPLEQRLGPGGLDPLEVIETLPPGMVAAFESRDVEQLKQVLMEMDADEAEAHMKRCIDAGLWVA
jgi:cell division cycle protein 37